ncbi:MAG TPA: c-type cytochrome [Acidobacteriaceae bacterium]|nr:c-type cytochrome [Acidobacteriaceae bacterium]
MSRFIGFMLTAALTACLAGCRQDMQNQPKILPLRGSAFFPDGRSARRQLDGTVARGQEAAASYFLTGMTDGKEGEGLPFPVTMQVLRRGQERFNIYCSPCHSRVGNGQGRVVQRGYRQAANFHSIRLLQAPAGHFFNVMTHGFGAMPDYHAELAPVDRWAVVAYIRALQLSQDAKPSDAAPGARVVSLTQIASDEGLPPAFADANWTSKTSPAPPSAAPRPPQTSASTAALVAAATPAPGRRQEAGSSQSGSKTEEKPAESEKKSTPPAAAGDAAAGKQIYMQNCLMCHQANRQGLPPMIPSLVDIVTRVGVDKIKQTVTHGVPTANPPMPSFEAKLTPADIENLLAFLKTKP